MSAGSAKPGSLPSLQRSGGTGSNGERLLPWPCRMICAMQPSTDEEQAVAIPHQPPLALMQVHKPGGWTKGSGTAEAR